MFLDEFMNVVITWEYPGGDLEVNPLVTVEIDGVTSGTGQPLGSNVTRSIETLEKVIEFLDQHIPVEG